jgi:proline iminopeptidase
MSAVLSNGFTLNYHMEGSGELAVLVIGSSVYYPRTFSSQLRNSLRFVWADLPHFVDPGAELDVAAIGFEFYANCVERVREAAGLESVVIVGHSHHGNIAVEYANRFPQHVSHIVLIGSPPVGIDRTLKCAESYWQTNASGFRKAVLEKRRASLDEGYLISLPPKDAYITRYVNDAPLYWHDPEYDASWLWHGMEFRIEAIMAFRNLYQEYELHWSPALSAVPILVVMGRDDYAVPPTLWTRGRRETRNVDVRVLDRSGHTPQLEQPDVFDRMFLEWLRQNRARAR